MRRRLRLGSAQASAIVLSLGILTLFTLLAGEGLGGLTQLIVTPIGGEISIQQVVALFIRIAVVTVAMAVVIGVFNLLGVHFTRVVWRKGGWVYSIVMLISFLAGLITYFTDRDTSMILLEDVQISIESAVAGLLFFTLVYGAYRMMHREVTWSRVLFFVVLLIFLIGSLPLTETESVLTFSNWLMEIPVNAGGRGILMGIALATVVTGMRVLLGQDRSYRE